MEYSINERDERYRNAINYDKRPYFNWPGTITVDNALYILPFGTKDKLTTLERGKELHIIGENRGLSYASLVVINPTEQSINSAYADNLDDSFFDWEIEQQIQFLSNYLDY